MIGTRLGHYEITAKLGEGGMGEVYRASDTKLKREVAIKVLPAAFTEDRDRLSRFEREAQVLAQLHHPNIASIFGLDDSDGQRALVMELVEGPTLAERLNSGPLPLEEAVSIARQIAEALETAHEKGIVHRDLKPQNVKASLDGRVKVLDFGLAKAMDSMGSALGPGSTAQLAQSPTLTLGATQMGVILGTAAYMAPEQAKGLAVDKRADIWAFGVVLYEMLSGERLFIGETVPETLAAVIRAEIDLGRLPTTTPPSVRELVRRCLERDPKRRLRDIGEARFLLEAAAEAAPGKTWLEDAPSPAASAPMVSLRRRDLWVAIAFVTTVAAAIVGLLLERTDRARTGAQTPGGRATRLAFVPSDGVTADEGTYDSTIVSPNGQMLLFTGRSAGGRRQLWLRPLDAMETRPLPDTEDAIEPFWAPDSRSVGFGAGGKLRRIDLAGGKAQALADAPRLNGGAWSRDGVILFSPDFNAGLYRVPAMGGETTLVSRPDPARGEAAHHLPCFLPDGRRFLYRVPSASGGPSRLLAGALDSGEVKELLADAALAVFAPPHWLLYARNEVLVAQALDPDTLELRDEPIPVATELIGGAGFNTSRFSVSDNGVLILQNPKEHDYRLVWFDRAGHRLGAVGPPAQVINNGQSPEISPDGKRVTIQRADPRTRNEDIWVIDLERGTENRLTIDPGYDQLPVWSPDSSSVFFARRGLYRVAASGGGEERLLKGTVFPKDVSLDGRLLVFAQRGERTRADIWALPLSGERRPYPLLQSEFDEYQPQVSPDGRWLAYNSDQTGRQELYVRPLTAEGKLGEATQISVGSGLHPRWRRDGRELYYVAAPASILDGRMMAVAVKTSGSTLEVGAPTELFRVAMFPNTTASEYDVTADGQRFLVGTVEGASNAAAVTIVLNWTADLKR